MRLRLGDKKRDADGYMSELQQENKEGERIKFEEKLELLVKVNRKYSKEPHGSYARAKEDYKSLIDELEYLIENKELKYEKKEYNKIIG